MTGFVQKVVIFEKSEKVKKHDKNEPNIKEWSSWPKGQLGCLKVGMMKMVIVVTSEA
jgi:hypothetical protein